MNREYRKLVRRRFYDTLAIELAHHKANGSEFIFWDGRTEADAGVVDLHLKILDEVIAYCRRKAQP